MAQTRPLFERPARRPAWLAAVGLLALVACDKHPGTEMVTPATERPAAGSRRDASPDGAEANLDAADARTGNMAPSSLPARPDAPICTEAVCCVGPGCPKRAAGLPCQMSEQCETGFCADGVCCNVACKGACVSCNQADRMGECLPVSAGDPDPHLLCRQDAPESCGQTGVCNGMGGCAKYAPGTLCGDSQCPSRTGMRPPSECDGDGTCVVGTPIECSPYVCEGDSCRVTCSNDSHCVPPRVCSNGSCGQRGNGQSCTAADQCESGFCVDGVCCESACAGRCSTCASAKARGRCVMVAAGTPDPRAAQGRPGACIDQGGSSCGDNGRCDGKGGCETYRSGTACGAATCDGASNTATAAGVCNAGRCIPAQPRSCAPFRGCAGTRCSTHCDSDKDCATGVCVNGSCGKRPIGSVCSRDDECATPGVCAQGRCCATTCDKTCLSCNLDSAPGTCQPVPKGGADPAGACRNDACSNGCDGAGGCRREAEGTTCGAAKCDGASKVAAQRCNAAGQCVPLQESCASGQSCRDNRCSPDAKKEPGGSCGAPDDCASGVCLDGRCCAGACSGPCRNCTEKSGWRCSDRPDSTVCGNKLLCRVGRCVPECATGHLLCGSECLDVRVDPDNCGACAKKCESRLCEKGACLPVPCPKGQLKCGPSCFDLLISPKHCGACDRACEAPTPICYSGKCVRSVPDQLPPPDTKPPTGPDKPTPVKDAAPPSGGKDAGASKD